MIYTVGHGARSAAAFVSLLQQARIDLLVDVRAYPASRRHPHFSRDSLSATLGASGYAAHMETPLFTDAATALIAASRTQALCLMCAETNPADCHRSHISDWLVAHGERVLHLVGPGEQREHAARLF